MSVDERAQGKDGNRTRGTRPSTFVCEFCEFEDKPQALKEHLLDKHALEIANDHWGNHLYRVEQEGEP